MCPSMTTLWRSRASSAPTSCSTSIVAGFTRALPLGKYTSPRTDSTSSTRSPSSPMDTSTRALSALRESLPASFSPMALRASSNACLSCERTMRRMVLCFCTVPMEAPVARGLLPAPYPFL